MEDELVLLRNTMGNVALSLESTLLKNVQLLEND